MKYVALLRGVNVGGNSLVKMAHLKLCFENMGFPDVITYINSGNVIFKTDRGNIKELVEEVEKALLKDCGFEIKIAIISHDKLKKIVNGVPSLWKRDDVRKYISFVIPPSTVDQVIREIEIRDGIDFVEKGDGVIYMTTLLEGLMKSSFSKLIGKKIYKEMTMRNFNTGQKILAIMEKESRHNFENNRHCLSYHYPFICSDLFLERKNVGATLFREY